MTGTGYYVILPVNVDADLGKEIADAQATGALGAMTL